MNDPGKPPTYLEEAAAILRSALEAAENRYNAAIGRPRTPEDRRELLEARVRVAEGFARLHEAACAGGARPEPEGQDHA